MNKSRQNIAPSMIDVFFVVDVGLQYNLQLTDSLKGGQLYLDDRFLFPGGIQVKLS